MSAAALALGVALVAGCGGETADSSPSAQTAAHWSYEGEDGPAQWAELDESYVLCADGSSQSPIDVVELTPAELTDPGFEYEAGTATVDNTGHTVQANAAPGSILSLDGETYQLAQMHFHAPGEHALDGARAPVEAHFVHKTDDGRIAVVGVGLTAGTSPNDAWQPFVDALSVEEGAHAVEAPLDWSALLPASRATIRYDGSLTTPPCTEGVRWVLLQEPVALGAEQLEVFEAAFTGNARPVQPVHDRRVVTDAEDD